MQLWETQTGQRLASASCHDKAASGAALLPSGDFVTSSWDCTAKVWDLRTLTEKRRFVGHKVGIGCLSVNGNLVATGDFSEQACIWNSDDMSVVWQSTGDGQMFNGCKQFLESMKEQAPTAIKMSIALMKEGQKLVTGGTYQGIKVRCQRGSEVGHRAGKFAGRGTAL
jgi:WD40 repeat protein